MDAASSGGTILSWPADTQNIDSRWFILSCLLVRSRNEGLREVLGSLTDKRSCSTGQSSICSPRGRKNRWSQAAAQRGGPSPLTRHAAVGQTDHAWVPSRRP